VGLKKITTKQGEDKWEVDFRLEGRGSKRLRRRFDKKVDAQNFERYVKKQQEDSELTMGKQCSFQGTTFKKEALNWYHDAEGRFSAGHLVNARRDLRYYFSIFGKWTPDRIDAAFVTKLQRKFKANKLSNATVNRKIHILSAIMTFAVRQRRIPYNPMQGYRVLPRDRVEMTFLTKDEAESFLEFTRIKYEGTKHAWVYLAYLLAVNTGMRAGEIWGLKVRDLRFKDSLIYVCRQLNIVTRNFTIPKGKAGRQVPLNENLAGVLKEHIEKLDLKGDDPIFLNENDRPIYHEHFNARHFRKDVKAWGERKFRFHDLRHTAATLMIGMGVDVRSVQEICGHKDIKTTMNYVHILGDNVKKVAQDFSVGGEILHQDLPPARVLKLVQ